LVFVACAREVHETQEHYTVTPSVTPMPPMDPSYPPVNPSYPPVNPSYPPAPMDPSYPPTPVVQPPQVVTTSGGVPSWANDVVRETGQGAVPSHMIGTGQGRLMAERAARLDAQRKLLERVIGLRLDSKTTVGDFVTESDRMSASTSGYIKNSYEIGKNMDPSGDTANVTMELKLYDVYMYMRTSRIYYE